MTEQGPKITEFWLKKHKDIPELNFFSENSEIYRTALGELIEAMTRKTYRPYEYGFDDMNLWNKSGSIGFMDVTTQDRNIPKEGAKPYPNFAFQYSPDDFEEKKSLVILCIGIEPKYRGMGYARLLKRHAEKIAQEWNINIIVGDDIENPIMRSLNERMGYTLYHGGTESVKRLR